MIAELVREFQQVGRELSQLGLVTCRGGNMSVLVKGWIYATAHEAMLGRLLKRDIIKIAKASGPAQTKVGVTSDILVHRCIYDQTPAQAIIHAHPNWAIALSFRRREIVPKDVEGAYHLSRVPVVGGEFQVGSAAIAHKLAAALTQVPVAIFRGHGCFARGASLWEALHLVTALEASATVLVIHQLLRGERKR